MSNIDTEVVVVDAVRPEEAKIERAAAMIRAGECVVFPTETVYGLGADALQLHAVERIFAAKGRPFGDPLIVHIADEGTLQVLASSLPKYAKELTRAFWPGPLTLIVPRSPLVPTLVTAGLETVAVRMPRHPVALALIRAAGSPVAAPSANRFMHISPTTAQHAFADLKGRVPLILDSGPCEVGVESTVLDLCAAVPIILRPGGVSIEELRTVVPDVQLGMRLAAAPDDVHAGERAQKSPGQLLTHYAPAVPLLLFVGNVEMIRGAMLAEVRRRRESGELVGVLVADEDVPGFVGSGALVHSLGDAADSAQLAAALFAGLRDLESGGVEVILCRGFGEKGLGLAIHDRLLRAAAGKVVEAG